MEIKGQVKVFSDNGGNEYLAFEINPASIQDYQKFLASKVDAEFIENQKKRDNETHHITLLNATQVGSTKKNHPENLEAIYTDFQSITEPFVLKGIGSVVSEKPNKDTEDYNVAYFAIVENSQASEIRQKHFSNWNHQQLHCTLGFKDKDVHGPTINKSLESLKWTHSEIQNSQLQRKVRPKA